LAQFVCPICSFSSTKGVARSESSPAMKPMHESLRSLFAVIVSHPGGGDGGGARSL